MLFAKKKPKKTDSASWVPLESGYEKNCSAYVINRVIGSMKKRRTSLIIAAKDYQSGTTILYDYNKENLFIDKPLDFPDTISSVRVCFVDESKITNYFDVKVLSVSKDTILTPLPKEVFRLQRRSEFRVAAPHGCQVSFSHQGELCEEFSVVNISIKGMLCCSKSVKLSENANLKDIMIDLSAYYDSQDFDEMPPLSYFAISSGRVVRSYFERETGKTCYGVAFECSPEEEKNLAGYVRQREIELLKKGIA